MSTSQETGRHGEALAAQLLESQGYTIFDTNYRFLQGEIDIVAYIPEEIVFVEVKTRGSTRHAWPEEAVTAAQQRKLFEVADAYLYERKLQSLPARFDIIAIDLSNPDDPDIRHYVDAFRRDVLY